MPDDPTPAKPPKKHDGKSLSAASKRRLKVWEGMTEVEKWRDVWNSTGGQQRAGEEARLQKLRNDDPMGFHKRLTEMEREAAAKAAVQAEAAKPPAAEPDRKTAEELLPLVDGLIAEYESGARE